MEPNNECTALMSLRQNVEVRQRPQGFEVNFSFDYALCEALTIWSLEAMARWAMVDPDVKDFFLNTYVESIR